MYEEMFNFLEKNGYKRYEISNFCKLGYHSRHNSSYWENVPYIGIGCSASSYIDNTRYENVADVSQYISSNGIDCIVNIESISVRDEISEFFFLGLRQDKGISQKLFKKRFQKNMYDLFDDQINKLIYNDLLIAKGDTIKLTQKGVNLSNYVFQHFL